jgi:hypothetical protein
MSSTISWAMMLRVIYRKWFLDTFSRSLIFFFLPQEVYNRPTIQLFMVCLVAVIL